MTRSHPPSLRTLVSGVLRRDCALPQTSKIGVAVSGGPDSMALLHVLANLRRTLGFELCALSVDHGLRPEAGQELQVVEAFCQELSVPFCRIALSLKDGGNLQERARDARYEALWRKAREHAGEQVFLATAHHKDDRAETVLLRVLRGTSLPGLAVLPAREGALLRPMIRATRAEVESYLQRHKIAFCEDPSNQQTRFLRVRVRHEILPLLRELNPGVVDHLATLAEEAEELSRPLGLNREQRSQIRRALLDPQLKLDLPLPAGLRILRVE